MSWENWAIKIPFSEKADAELALTRLNLANYYSIIERYYIDEANAPPGVTLIAAPTRAETIETIMNEWPAEDQSRLYHLLYNAGIRINR